VSPTLQNFLPNDILQLNKPPAAAQSSSLCTCPEVTRLAAENERLASENWRLAEENARLRAEFKTYRQDGFATIGRARLEDLRRIPAESLAVFDEDLKALRKMILTWDDGRMNNEARERLVDMLDKYNVRYGKGDEKEANCQAPWKIFHDQGKSEGERIRGAWRNRRYWALDGDEAITGSMTGGNLKAAEALDTLIELFRWRGME
jgi:hypothetical protein